MQQVPLLFLDIDGVLTSDEHRRYKKTPEGKERVAFLRSQYDTIEGIELVLLDPKRVALLKEIVLRTNCKIVISSTWRENSTAAHFERLFKLLGHALPNFTVIGLTPILDHIEQQKRGHEINAWIKSNNFQGKYLALDDDPKSIFLDEQTLHRTTYADGLTPPDVEAIVALLK